MISHRALMIVDVQRAFEPPAKFLEKLERYAQHFPRRVYTRFVNPPGSLFRRLLKQKRCAPGSEDLDFILPPQPGDLVFDKVARYGLEERQLRKLHALKIRSITVCGLDTDACVLGVMFSLFDAGIRCHLKEDMCWSSSGLHRAALKIIREQFKHVE